MKIYKNNRIVFEEIYKCLSKYEYNKEHGKIIE